MIEGEDGAMNEGRNRKREGVMEKQEREGWMGRGGRRRQGGREGPTVAPAHS